MMPRLLQILAFANVPAGGNAVLPHEINVAGVPAKPDFVAFDAAGFTAVVTDTTCTVTNNNIVPASVNVWLELKHSIPRELGALSTTSLVPRPFIAVGGGGGGSGGSIQEDVFFPINGQTVFTLSQPYVGGFAVVFINGVEYVNTINFTIVGTTLTWLDTPFTLAVTDLLVADYAV